MKPNDTYVSVLPAVSVTVHCKEPGSPHRPQSVTAIQGINPSHKNLTDINFFFAELH